MRVKAVMWAIQNPTKKLFFVVVHYEHVKRASLLEMELKDFFQGQHNLQNVEVLGLPTNPKDTLSRLLRLMAIRPHASLMVDELIMPGGKDKEEMKKEHENFKKELEQLQNHQSKAPLWIACAGVTEGSANHFERSYLKTILPPAFHFPEMDVPLRNTKETLAMAGLDENTDVKGLGNYCASTRTRPVYKIPDYLMTGVRGKEFLVNITHDKEEVMKAVEAASRNLLSRTGGLGFPLLCNVCTNSTLDTVKRGVVRAGAAVLVYQGTCNEVEVEQWLRRRRNGEEERVLIADPDASRGWEASHVLVVDLSGLGLSNLIMRTVGYCAVVKQASDLFSYSNHNQTYVQ